MDVRAVTPMLVPGPSGSTEVLKEGQLAPGLEGSLYEHVFAGNGSREELTVVVTSVPETVAFAPALVCRDRASLGNANPAQLPAERWAPVELESVAFNRRYHVLTLVGQDPGWVRELFSPELIAWLTDRAPAGLSFELNEGHLAIGQPGPLESPDALLAAAAQLRTRIEKEALEEDLNPDLFDESAEVAAVLAAMAEVEWKTPPASVSAAEIRYADAARWKPRVVINGLFVAAILGAIALAGLSLLGSVLFGLAVGLILAVLGFGAGRWWASHRYRWGDVSVKRVALEAWARGYAKSRKLELVDRWRWHSDHRALPLPGFADHVLFGPIQPDSKVEGWFAMLGDAAEMRSTGEEVAYIADRPLASSALVVLLEKEPSDEEIAALELPEHYAIEHAGNEVVVWMPVAGNLIRTSKGSDRFREKAAKVLAPILSS